ncbi:UDP-N-acetylglucosamine 1-carboxyvinyltransferase 2 [Clostridia bacterium]|nr:UDP-N-acetylglucosamine 1-carboxyvinyltransferase 2 [Clostridia bacterium]
MEKIIINGGRALNGSVEISGMKNTAVAVLMGSVLIDDVVVLENIPDIADVMNSFDILTYMGAVIRKLGPTTYEIDNTRTRGGSSPSPLVRKMRGSYYLLGAEVGRFGRAFVDQPGGCFFGIRAIDQHEKGFVKLGGTMKIAANGYYDLRADDGLHGAQIFLDMASVGATINIMLAAVKAVGTTVIENAAREPHVVDLANFLNACGANITGTGTSTIKIKGVDTLHGCTYAILPDMIEAGTYMAAAGAVEGSSLTIKNVIPKHLESITAKLRDMGLTVTELDDAVKVERTGDIIKTNMKTVPYPGLPSDMNAPMGVLMCLANGGSSVLSEGIFDNKFRYTEELQRMGASVSLRSLKDAVFEGVGGLHGANVDCVDLRAGAAMVVAGLAAVGRTEIGAIHHIERGYDNMVQKLRAVGADIRKISIGEGMMLNRRAN